MQTLKKPWSIADTPYPPKTHRLPAILSQEEVAQLIDAACTPFHRILLMTLCATGVRNAELRSQHRSAGLITQSAQVAGASLQAIYAGCRRRISIVAL